MRVLVLGGRGYIGSVLTDGTDAEIYDIKDGNDIRDIDKLYPAIMRNDCIVHLAGLSNDQAVNSAPIEAWESNYRANETIANLVKYSDKRLIFASSCSVYGDSDEQWVDERSDKRPLLMYARAKALSEDLFNQPSINSFIFRFSTVCGYSPNMRWDLVVNTMVKSLKETGKIIVSGGDQWRPLVHVLDVAKAIMWASCNERRGIYNLGDNENNFKIKDLGKLVSQLGGEVQVNHKDTDQRSYRVKFDKINSAGFKTNHSIIEAAREVYESF